MINYTVYLPNGAIQRSGVCAPEDFELQPGAGELVLEGLGNSSTQWVVGGSLVDLPAKPTDSDCYNFDYASGSWVFDLPRATSDALFMRDLMLKEGPDRISPLWWDSMTADVKAVWMQYRQALLDVPAQAGFPKTIVWPPVPTVG